MSDEIKAITELEAILPQEFKQKKKPIPYPLGMRETLAKADELSREEFKIFYYLSYLTGARATEALRTKGKDFSVNEHDNAMIVQLQTEKNRREPLRNIPIPLYGTEETAANKVLDYVQSIGENEHLFNFNRITAWRALGSIQINTRAIFLAPEKKVDDYSFPLFPHFLRHSRLTHLVVDYGYDASRLKAFAGWSSLYPATYYVHLSWKNLLAPIRSASMTQPVQNFVKQEG